MDRFMRDFGRVIPASATVLPLALALINSPCAAQLPCSYEADIVFGPDCGGFLGNAAAFGISEQGDLSGEFGCPAALPDAFVSWDANGLTPLAALLPPGTYVSRAEDVENGMVAGDFASPGMAGGFFLHGGTTTIIPPPPGTNYIDVYGLNRQGVVVGAWGNTVSGPLLFPRAFWWRDGVLHDLQPDFPPGGSWATDANDHGAITGYMAETAFPDNAHAFIWENGVVTDLGLMPGSIGTEGWGINNKRQVCGVAWFLSKHPQGFQRRGFFWDKGVFTDIGVIPGFDDEMQPQDIADDGTIIGFMNEGPGFVWKTGVLRNIDTLVTVPKGRAGGAPRDTTRAGPWVSVASTSRRGQPTVMMWPSGFGPCLVCRPTRIATG
jgi:probable HAF family extracellular repeat protein